MKNKPALYPRSLYGQLIGLIGFILIAATLSYGWVTSRQQAAAYQRLMTGYASIMALNVAESCAHYILIEDYAGLGDYIARSSALPNVMRIRVYESAGNVVGDAGPDSGKALHDAGGHFGVTGPEVRAVEGGLDIWQPIEAGTRIGWVRMSYSLSAIGAIKARIWRDSILLGALWALVDILLFMALLSFPVRAIRKVNDFARGLVTSKGRQIEVPRMTREIEQLSESLNYASRELAATDDALRGSLKEKEVLLQEIHHRVKNNMTVIISLLKLQERNIANPEAKAVLRESRNRVHTMALLHETLYRSGDFNAIDFEQYIGVLIDGLLDSYRGYPGDGCRVSLDIDKTPLSMDTLIPCGLIINELVTNSLKHAFVGVEAPEIAVRFQKREDGQFLLSVRDNGTGIPGTIDIDGGKTLGIQIVKALAAQLRGSLDVDQTGGTAFNIVFTPKGGHTPP